MIKQYLKKYYLKNSIYDHSNFLINKIFNCKSQINALELEHFGQ